MDGINQRHTERQCSLGNGWEVAVEGGSFMQSKQQIRARLHFSEENVFWMQQPMSDLLNI